MANNTKKRILVMDDDELIRELFNEMINILGHETVIVANGEEAIAAYKSAVETGNKFDLLILDLTIAVGMSGLETMKKLKELDNTIKAIVSTGHDIEELKYKEYGFCGAITKPFNLNQIKKVLDEYI
ncbi:MAG: response regulator [Thermodesulfovibrionales bacterium]|nr:response regulator [Thermodesulfovibrionales bacterium]